MRNRKKGDAETKRKWELKAKHKLANLRNEKLKDKKKLGHDILMPEVFVSNYMK